MLDHAKLARVPRTFQPFYSSGPFSSGPFRFTAVRFFKTMHTLSFLLKHLDLQPFIFSRPSFFAFEMRCMLARFRTGRFLRNPFFSTLRVCLELPPCDNFSFSHYSILPLSTILLLHYSRDPYS
jgi:hypothetical protein